MLILALHFIGTNAETFLIRDCFIKEMLSLYDGVELTVGKQSYFIQARVILHGYDTRALQPVLRASMESKKFSCCPLCSKVNTYLSGNFGVGTIEGGRYHLPLKHFLRAMGQSLRCCPQHYYRTKRKVLPEEALNPDIDVTMIRPKAIYDDLNKLAQLQSCDPKHYDDPHHATQWNSFIEAINNENTPSIWYHEKIDQLGLKDYLYFPHCDYRPFVPHTRTTNREYTNEGMDAIINGRPTISGICGLWLFTVLSYANVATQVCWDPFHTLGNIAKYIFKTWKDERPMRVKCVNFCKYTHCHPELYMPVEKEVSVPTENQDEAAAGKKRKKTKKVLQTVIEKRPPWILPADARKYIEAVVNCILVPTGYSQSFQIRNIFTQTGFLNETAKIQIVTTLMELIVWLIRKHCPNYPSAYLLFNLMLCEDFRLILQPSISVEGEIPWMLLRTIEMTETHTGLFPPSESKLVYHQAIELVSFMKNFGPVHGWWTLPMERALHTIKKSKPQGGSSYQITITKRHLAQELNTLKHAYDFDITNSLVDNPFLLHPAIAHNIIGQPSMPTLFKSNLKKGSLFVQDGKINVTSQAISLHHRQKYSHITFSPGSVEHRELLQLLVREVFRLSDESGSRAFQESCLYRLHCTFELHLIQQLLPCEQQPNDFYDWMCAVLEHLPWIHKQGLIVEGMPTQRNSLSLADIYQMKDFWMKSFTVFEYKQAVIFGVQFRSRGSVARETADDNTTPGIVNNADNVLKVNFFHKKNYSSWFQCYLGAAPTKDAFVNAYTLQTVDKVGQFNFFFRFVIGGDKGSDKLLNKIPLASVTMRNHQKLSISMPNSYTRVGSQIRYKSKKDRPKLERYETQILSIDCTTHEESYSPENRFIPLTRVYSTAFLFLPLNAGDEALNRDLAAKQVRQGEASSLTSLLLIGLHAARRNCIQFELNKVSTLYHNTMLDYDGYMSMTTE